MKPRNALTFNQICNLQTDHKDTKHFWIMAEPGRVSIVKQINGHLVEAEIEIPRREFNILVDWYNRDQKPYQEKKPKKARHA